MQWFLELMEELGIECRVGHPAKIRRAETRKQKHDRRDARLLLTLLAENRFPTIWMPSTEQRDLRTLLRHRPQHHLSFASSKANWVIGGGDLFLCASRQNRLMGSSRLRCWKLLSIWIGRSCQI
jgi:hypothetical protein